MGLILQTSIFFPGGKLHRMMIVYICARCRIYYIHDIGYLENFPKDDHQQCRDNGT